MKGGEIFYFDMSNDEWLFDGDGDLQVSIFKKTSKIKMGEFSNVMQKYFQFDIYRFMQQETGNSWMPHCPKVKKTYKTKAKTKFTRLKR